MIGLLYVYSSDIMELLLTTERTALREVFSCTLKMNTLFIQIHTISDANAIKQEISCL